MIIADLPLDDADLHGYDGIDVPHDRLATSDALEPGQLLVVRTLDGVCRCAEVVGLQFTSTDTVYELRLGQPMRAAAVRSLTHGRPAPRRWVSDADLVGMLVDCARLDRRTERVS
jgi:hypothetical protein